MKIPNIGIYLKSLRKEQKKTLKDIGDAVNASASYISQIEKGVRNPSDDALMDVLSKAFNMREIDAEDLIRKWRIQQYKQVNEGEGYLQKKEKLQSPLIPYFREIPKNFIYAQGDEYWPFFVEDPEVAKDLFIWKMNDDSMEPHIPDEAILILNKDTSNLPYRSLVLVRTENKTTVRYFEKRDDKYKLIPANNKYPVYFGGNVEVLGRVEKMLINV